MKFKSRGARMIYAPRIGKRIYFEEDGTYETNDEAEITALKRSRNVEVVEDGDSLIRSKDRPSPRRTISRDPDLRPEPREEKIEAKNYTRKELETLAERVGIDDLDKYPTKAKLAAAINRIPHRG